ncbi:hypothetical protein IG9_03350, partial [Bacillus cereus HuA2-9]
KEATIEDTIKVTGLVAGDIVTVNISSSSERWKRSNN